MSKLTVLFVFAALVCAAVAFNHRDPEFRDYVRKFEKSYHPTEVHRRYQAFVASKKRVEARNAEATARGFSTRYGLTKYSDLYPEEFNRLYKGYKKGSKDSSTIRAPQPIDYSLNVPDSYDWSQQGATTPIKDQGQCGSCWAFSATEGLESAWYLAKKKLPVLAPQQLVDCSWLDMGCDGGEIENAFRYIESYGLDTEASYPYVSGESGEWSGSCQYSTSNVGARMSTWYYATSNNNETQMLYVSYAKGPLSVCVDAETWQDYTGGVVENNCSDSLDHCVQLVGWGSDANNTPYWIVRNSWGTDWGLDGYIWIERNSDLCGISDDAAYVVV